MSRIRTIPPGSEDASPELAEAYARVGLTPERRAHVMEVHSLNPPALAAHHALYRAVQFGPSPLSRAEREMIAVVVSAANDCFY